MQLRPYQRQAIDATYAWFESNSGNPLLVLPTGAGKSVIIGKMCQEILDWWPNQRIILLSHVKELLEQNFGKIMACWNRAPAGLYCAGLKQKRAHDPITVASIQSVHKKAHVLGWRDLMIIDECHLLADADTSMYRNFISMMKMINPKMKILGLSATPYRLKTGMLHEGDGAMFDDIAYEVTLKELIGGGYLCPLIGKASVTQGDFAKVHIKGGEYMMKEAEQAMDKEAITQAALNEIQRLGGERKTWLIFCTGVNHALHVRDAIRERGISSETISQETPSDDRARILREFKEGKIQAVTNVNVLTTGFDAPNIDLIGLLRPTLSPGLYTQMLGRGMRLSPETGKSNCLVLDFAGNIEKHGPITHVKPPKSRKKKDKKPERYIKEGLICPHCRSWCEPEATECADCGMTFERPERVKHSTEATMAEVMSDEPEIKQDAPVWITVRDVTYHLHAKLDSPRSLRVTYHCSIEKVNEWVCLEHTGYANQKAQKWWLERSPGGYIPQTVNEALRQAHLLKRPSKIKVRRTKGKYLEVMAYDFSENYIAQPGREKPSALSM